MWKTEEETTRELRRAFRRELPGEEFESNLRQAIATESGGEHEISITPKVRFLSVAAVLAAACVIGLWFVPDRPAERDFGTTAREAGLPLAGTGVEEKCDLEVRADGLKPASLATAVKKLREKGKKDPSVLILAEGSRPWGSVHAVLQVLASKEVAVRRVRLAVMDPKTKKQRTLPVPIPSDAALSPRPAVRPLELVLSRDVKETQTRIEYNGRELGRDDKGLDVIARNFRNGTPKDPGKLDVRLEGYSSVPCQQMVRALDLLREAGFGSIGLSIDAPTLLMFHVHLDLKDGRVLLGHEGRKGQRSLSFTDGLKSLNGALDGFKARGRKPKGLIDAGVYIPQDKVEKVEELFRKAGFGDCIRIT